MEKESYYKYFFKVDDKTKECGWRWEQCDYKKYQEEWKKNRNQVCKSR